MLDIEMALTQSNNTQETHSASVTTVVSGITNETDSTTIPTTESVDDSSSVLSFYFKVAVVVLGAVGTIANGTTLFAFFFAEQVMGFSLRKIFCYSLKFVFS
jgi:hypothetical protein